jgi:hypothetical protein
MEYRWTQCIPIPKGTNYHAIKSELGDISLCAAVQMDMSKPGHFASTMEETGEMILTIQTR